MAAVSAPLHGAGPVADLRNRQTRKDTTSQNKRDGDAQEQPELRVVGRLGELAVGVLLERLCHAPERHGQRGNDGREGVEEADEDESSCSQRRAIARAGTSGTHGHGRSCEDAGTEVRRDEDGLGVEGLDRLAKGWFGVRAQITMRKQRFGGQCVGGSRT
jgi:hypothetical protein